MFQPGEEGWDGARYMVEEGVLDAAGRRADCAYGLHVLADRLPRGTFATRPGPLLAASAALRVTVHGAGGHGSTPHLSRDPITAAATMVTGLQTLVTRRFDVFDPVVLTVGTFAAGTKRNIIPDEARFEATVRTFSAEALDRIAEEAPRLCRRIASGYGCEAEVELVGEYPLTRNDPAQAEFALQVLREVFGEQRTQSLRNPHTAAEDFSRVLDEVPGCYMFLGAHPGDDWHGPTNHSPRAEFDDEVLAEGTLLHAQLAVWALRRDLASVGAPEGAS
jgi:hippurate hydrolase